MNESRIKNHRGVRSLYSGVSSFGMVESLLEMVQ